MRHNRFFLIFTAGLVAAMHLVSCSTVPKQEHPLLPLLRQLGADLPVRRTELVAKCHLKNVPSTRMMMGLRGGWGGTFESWSLPDGGALIGRFNTYSGGYKVVRDNSNEAGADRSYPFPGGIPKVPATTWFNEVVLVDREKHIRFSNEKRPAALGSHGSLLPGN